MKIAVLGAGMVGRAIALDLVKEHLVTSFDLESANLQRLSLTDVRIDTVTADLSHFDSYSKWLLPFEIVVTAVPGFMGYKTLEAVILAGKDVVDISFFPENALLLDRIAKTNNVTAITDCGVAPGVSNLIVGRYNEEFKIIAFECYVGGLPEKPEPPFYYKAPFSPVDVIQEYLRPSRLVENGTIVTKPAMSDRELMNFDKVGTLEAFNTDGLRSLIYTMPAIPEMKEKTLRYPGHIDLILSMQQAGFFDTSSIKINGFPVRPLDVTSKILVKQWKLGADEPEFTIMKVIVRGETKIVQFDLLDKYDAHSNTSSMARTTGYTCTAAVNLIAKGLFNDKGVFPPELVGKNKQCFDFVFEYLKQRNVVWKKSELSV